MSIWRIDNNHSWTSAGPQVSDPQIWQVRVAKVPLLRRWVRRIARMWYNRDNKKPPRRVNVRGHDTRR